MEGSYDEVAKKVNEEIAGLSDTATFTDFAEVDRKMGLPRGNVFEMTGFADYFAFTEDE